MIDHLFPKEQKYVDIDSALLIKQKNIPSKLYKYQSFNDYSIKNLLNSIVWLSSSENFNDPYDCMLTFKTLDLFNHFFPLNIDDIFDESSINEDIISKDEKTSIINSDNTLATFAKIMISKEETIKVENREEVLSTLLNIANKVASDIFKPFTNIAKESTVISCFSELNDSIVMWSHYANHHKGFCLEYDFRPVFVNEKISRLLYPVLYQEELLNVTEYHCCPA